GTAARAGGAASTAGRAATPATSGRAATAASSACNAADDDVSAATVRHGADPDQSAPAGTAARTLARICGTRPHVARLRVLRAH
ncbi:hypothetical protein MXEN_09379, partial [Mycobacterium xenopi RIVM700367]